MRLCCTIDADWIPGSNIGLERVYDFCVSRHLPVTTFVTGRFAEAYPDLIRETVHRGYELGTHGWEHPQNRAEDDFRLVPFERQYRWIAMATEAVTKICGVVPRVFRAPNLSVSESTLTVLEWLNYTVDSSVSPRRLPLGHMRINHLRYFMAPLTPYHPSRRNLARRGDSPILEVPPSAFLIPINMSTLRVLGVGPVLQATRRLARISPILVFYAHPAEFEVPERQAILPHNPPWYQRGLGPGNLWLLAQFVDAILKLGYRATTISEAASDCLC